MAKKNKTQGYVLELRSMIKSRTGADCEEWLTPQVRSTAMNMVMLDRIQNDLETNDLTTIEAGSMGQQKLVINPLLTTYKDLQRTLLQQYEALGLNYKTTPSKVREDTRKGVDEADPMAQMYQTAMRARMG